MGSEMPLEVGNRIKLKVTKKDLGVEKGDLGTILRYLPEAPFPWEVKFDKGLLLYLGAHYLRKVG